MSHRILSVEPGSIAEQMGLQPGDSILKINGQPLHDVLDYRFLVSDEVLEVEVLKKDGQAELIEVETDYQDLGLEFEDALLDKPKSCKNKCIFCFIDQLPKGMRPTMYFKDDDARLSFLQGNYITLTNLSEADIERIIRMRISPVNVSVHTTNPALRVNMLRNRHAGKVYDVMARLARHGIVMNCQIVLCRGINDGAELDRTIEDLSALYPAVSSISAVPVGLTAYRDGLYPLQPYDAPACAEVIAQVSRWQKRLLGTHGSRLVFLADEFYLVGGIPIPPEAEYEGFPQIENGVGLIASMEAEFRAALSRVPEKLPKARHVSIATGELACGFIRGLCRELEARCPSVHVGVYPIKNNFFGGGVTVSGLVCGCDIAAQLSGRDLGDVLFLPSSMLRSGEDILLDDVTTAELGTSLGVRIDTIQNDGAQFIEKLLGTELGK